MRNWLPLLLAFLLTVRLADASEIQAPDVSRFVLNNGLELVVIPDRRAPVATHMIWYKVGAADDPRGKSGLAHFLEHLLFKGTSTYPEGAFSNAISEIGGEENAFTSADYTAYYQKIAPSALRQMMVFEADRMRNVVLSEDVVLPELEVILEERSQRIDSNPGAIISEYAQAALFVHHPYGNPVIGWEHEIRQLTLEDAISFYDVWYQPSNAIVVVAGDVDADEVLSMARDTYGAITKSSIPQRVRVVEPPAVVSRKVEYEDQRVTSPSWRRIYLVPSYRLADERDAEALDLLAMILGGATSSRLHGSLVLGSEIASYSGAYNSASSRDMGSFTIYAEPRGDTDLKTLERSVDEEIQKVVQDGVTQNELDRALRILSRTVIYSRDNQVVLARIYGSELAVGGTIENVQNWLGLLQKVTVGDINRVAKKYLNKSRSVTSYLRSGKK